MLITLMVVAVGLAVAGTALRGVTDLGRTILIGGLAAGSAWLLIAALAVLFQRGKPLLLLVLIGAVAVAVTVYRRLGAPQAAAVGLGIVVATAIALV